MIAVHLDEFDSIFLKARGGIGQRFNAEAPVALGKIQSGLQSFRLLLFQFSEG